MHRARYLFSAFVFLAAGMVGGCTSATPGPDATAMDSGTPRDAGADTTIGRDGRDLDAPPTTVAAAFANGDFSVALSLCSSQPPDASMCDVTWCQLLAQLSLFVENDFNGVLLGVLAGGNLSSSAIDPATALSILSHMSTIAMLGAQANAGACTYTLDHLPMTIGYAAAPFVQGDLRGEWTPRDAMLIKAMMDSFQYVMLGTAGLASVPDAAVVDADGSTAGDGGAWTPLPLPELLSELLADLRAHDALLFSQQADPSVPRGGWLDVDHDGVPSMGDQLLVDFFASDGTTRLFDFSADDFVGGAMQQLPVGGLTQPATQRCGYNVWHIDTLIQSASVGTVDGMSFSPDGTEIAFEQLGSDGKSQVYIASIAAMLASAPNPPASMTCLTCSVMSNNDGVRWRPGDPNTLLFVSDVDHPDAIGGDGAGFGQELYAIHADGTQATRLTTSDVWSTNYHANWSPDGNHIVWGRTENRTWDVMVADFVSDGSGMRLENTTRVTHDTTWWETHGFTPDNGTIITTNTRGGLLETDLYAINLATGARTRLTNDPTWDEHGHVSPDGSQISWIAGRWNQDSIVQLTGADLSPVYDFFWIIPGIDYAFVNRPAGFSTELTLMNADGSNVRRVTTDEEVCADNEWSFDGTRIVFREASATDTPRLRMVTFDDCQ